MQKYNILIIISALLWSACSRDTDAQTDFAGEWSIPSNEVFGGGPGIDGIPALENPEFITPEEATYINDDDLIIGYKSGDDVKAYPHIVLDWHEIVNDEIGGKPIAVTYCPLTGTAIGWGREVNGNVTTYGVSGLLYNSNLIPYDRATRSAWSQMLLKSVNGAVIDTPVETFNLIETTWKTWRTMYPNTKILSLNTGHSRNYNQYPYINARGEDYRVDPFLLFPVSKRDERLHSKERVHGIIVDGKAKVFRFDSFVANNNILEDTFEGASVVVYGSKSDNIIVSFNRELNDGTILTFSPVTEASKGILKDNEGNVWDIFGEAVSGPRQGQVLIPTTSFMGFWFSWGTFYPTPAIFE